MSWVSPCKSDSSGNYFGSNQARGALWKLGSVCAGSLCKPWTIFFFFFRNCWWKQRDRDMECCLCGHWCSYMVLMMADLFLEILLYLQEKVYKMRAAIFPSGWQCSLQTFIHKPQVFICDIFFFFAVVLH